MSSACGCDSPEPTEEFEEELPWWRDWHVLVPIASGIFFLTGLVLEWSTHGESTAIVALVLFWIGLLLGAFTFVPGALRNLFTDRFSDAAVAEYPAVNTLTGGIRRAASNDPDGINLEAVCHRPVAAPHTGS